jgi:hypothetical protein
MESEPSALPTVISYARGPHDTQVVELARRLIEDGVPCDLDVFEARPPGGWSRWMTEKMTGTDIVLAVCSEPYYKRYHLDESPGVGKGATFEGGMLGRRVLEAQGSEHGVIPVVFDRTDVRWIPEFLRDETHFVLFEQYDDLYRVLTRQPAFVKPPLGKVRRMPPSGSIAPHSEPTTPGRSGATPAPAAPRGAPTPPALPLAVFRLGDGKLAFGRYANLVREKGTISMTLSVEDDEDAAKFKALRSHNRTLAVGWGVDAASVSVRDYREVHRDGSRVVETVLTEEERRSSFASEITYNGITPDQIALRRARRILLDERAAVSELGTFSTQRMNDDMLEHYVSGSAGSGGIVITSSPIPDIIGGAAEDTEAFEVARLVCAFLIITTNTVERITKLDLRRAPGGIAVDFVGIRARQYSNQDPPTLKVSGLCPVP